MRRHASSCPPARNTLTGRRRRRVNAVCPCQILNRLHEMVWHQQRALCAVGETAGYHSSRATKSGGFDCIDRTEKADVGGAGGVREPWSTVRHYSRLYWKPIEWPSEHSAADETSWNTISKYTHLDNVYCRREHIRIKNTSYYKV